MSMDGIRQGTSMITHPEGPARISSRQPKDLEKLLDRAEQAQPQATKILSSRRILDLFGDAWYCNLEQMW
jgi:hypothetical protein